MPVDLTALASHEVLVELSTEQRQLLSEHVANRLGVHLGEPVSVVPTTGPFVLVRHQRLGQDFVAVPGGSFRMGIDAEQAEALRTLLRGAFDDEHDLSDALEPVLEAARPVRTVEVRPFLLATSLLSSEAVVSLAPDLPADRFGVLGDAAVLTLEEAGRAVAASQMQLVSEAQWEYAARELGGRSWLVPVPDEVTDPLSLAPRGGCSSSLGVDWVSPRGEWVADGWHPNYLGAPSSSQAWEPGAVPGVHRGCHPWWQDPMEAVTLHCGVREPGSRAMRCGVRLALAL